MGVWAAVLTAGLGLVQTPNQHAVAVNLVSSEQAGQPDTPKPDEGVTTKGPSKTRAFAGVAAGTAAGLAVALPALALATGVALGWGAASGVVAGQALAPGLLMAFLTPVFVAVVMLPALALSAAASWGAGFLVGGPLLKLPWGGAAAAVLGLGAGFLGALVHELGVGVGCAVTWLLWIIVTVAVVVLGAICGSICGGGGSTSNVPDPLTFNLGEDSRINVLIGFMLWSLVATVPGALGVLVGNGVGAGVGAVRVALEDDSAEEVAPTDPIPGENPPADATPEAPLADDGNGSAPTEAAPESGNNADPPEANTEPAPADPAEQPSIPY